MIALLEPSVFHTLLFSRVFTYASDLALVRANVTRSSASDKLVDVQLHGK